MFTFPSRIAIVAGMHPPDVTIASTEMAVLRFCGYCMPWETMVDSRAMTGGKEKRLAAFKASWMSLHPAMKLCGSLRMGVLAAAEAGRGLTDEEGTGGRSE